MAKKTRTIKKNNTTKNETAIIEQWKTIISVQMHFNDMIMRARSLGITVVIAVYGAAAAAIGQYPRQTISIVQTKMHISVIGIALGMILLISIFSIDFFYYYRLLIGSVDRAEQLEELLTPFRKNRKIIEPGLTKYLTKQVSRDNAMFLLGVFYGLPLIFGIIFLIYVIFYYSPLL